MGRKKPLPVIEDVEIIELAAEGNAIARIDGKVLFVPKAIPGDIVDIQLTRKRTSFMEGYVVNYKKHSEHRIEPFCSHFGTCGGCKWQHLPYPEQLRWKQKQVTDNLQRIGGVEIEKVFDILPSENTRFYRNKLEYTFSNNRWLPVEMIKQPDFIREPGAGFHIQGMFDKVLDLDYCYHQPDPSNDFRLALKQYLLDNDLSFFDIREKKGFLRNLVVRNTVAGQWMLIVIFGEDNPQLITNTLTFLKDKFPALDSLMYTVNTKLNDTFHDLEIKLFYGNPYIIEKMEDLQFKIGPKSFFQTNTQQAVNLYSKVREWASLQSDDIVYDLYTGTGTIANFLAPHAKRVVGIEYVADAIEDANENSQINNISNTLFFAGDIKDLLNDSFFNAHGRPRVVVTDPPRAGMHPDVVNALLGALPETIVYVSCNPATQARDIKLMADKYKVVSIQPVDMFPHTHHVENIALLRLQ